MMYQSILICLSALTIFLAASCATGNFEQQSKQKEIARATQRLGEEQYKNGNFTAALKNLLQAKKSLADDPYLHNSLGLVYLSKNRPDLAENHFKQALRHKPDYIQAKNNLGGTYMKQEKWEPAVQLFKEVSESLLYATPEKPLSNLGWVYFHQSMFKQARRYFDQALDIRPGFINAVHGIASIYIKQQDYSNAFSFLHAALERNPGAAVLHADLAIAYEATGNLSQARNAWNVVLNLVPEQSNLAKDARKNLSRLE